MEAIKEERKYKRTRRTEDGRDLCEVITREGRRRRMGEGGGGDGGKRGWRREGMKKERKKWVSGTKGDFILFY